MLQLPVDINLIPYIGSDEKGEAKATNKASNVEEGIESSFEDITPGDAKVVVDHR